MWFEETLKNRLMLWKSYADLAQNPSRYTAGDLIVINLDEWIKSKDYRDKIAEKLGYFNNDRYLNFISDAGGGSSFDGGQVKNKNDLLINWNMSEQRLL